MRTILQPFSEQTLGEFLKVAFANGEYDTFQAAVAFVKHSGMQHIRDELRAFIEQGGYVRIVVGIDYYGTSLEGLSGLLSVIDDRGDIFVNHDENWYVSFHPKLYLFEAETVALLIVGSGNLTEGGLYTNDEASLAYSLDLSVENDKTVYEEIKMALDNWCNEDIVTVNRLDQSFLQQLLDEGYIKLETESKKEEAEARASDGATEKTPARTSARRTSLFGRGARRRRPARRRPVTGRESAEKDRTIIEGTEESVPLGFVMTLMRADVGVGQTTPGTSRRSPEIFVPLTARDRHPEFWGWPGAFSEDPSKPGKFDRRNVPVRIGGEITNVNMMTWPDKHDFRLRSETLRSAGQVGDIMRIERTDGDPSFIYYIEIVPQGTSSYDEYFALCDQSTPNSERKWGYYVIE
jgi:HKD family nuclease